jgi:steroid delta-isomerase-like uncharacterized protein
MSCAPHLNSAVKGVGMATATADKITDLQWLNTFRDEQVEAWNSHDPDVICSRMCDDVVRLDPTREGPIIGKKAVRQAISELIEAFPDLRIGFLGDLALTASGQTVYGTFHVAGTNRGTIKPEGIPATGKSGGITGIWVGEFRDGLLWHDSVYYDTGDLNRQLGILPARGSRAEKMMVRSRQLVDRVKRLRRR